MKEYAMKKNGIDAVAGYGRPNYSLYQETKKTSLSIGYHDEDYGTDTCINLQRMLNSLDIRDDSGTRLVEDGHFGKRTEQAVKKFQIKCGYNPTGICDQETWDALKKAADRKVTILTSISLPSGYAYHWDNYKDGYYHLIDIDIWISEKLVK